MKKKKGFYYCNCFNNSSASEHKICQLQPITHHRWPVPQQRTTLSSVNQSLRSVLYLTPTVLTRVPITAGSSLQVTMKPKRQRAHRRHTSVHLQSNGSEVPFGLPVSAAGCPQRARRAGCNSNPPPTAWTISIYS